MYVSILTTQLALSLDGEGSGLNSPASSSQSPPTAAASLSAPLPAPPVLKLELIDASAVEETGARNLSAALPVAASLSAPSIMST